MLLYGSRDGGPGGEAPLFDGLRDAGYVEGSSLVVERHYADAKPERFGAIVADAVRSAPAVIFVQGMDIAKVAQAATATVPIVAAGSEDPVKNGLVASLGRPGANVTGVTFMSPQLAGKRLDLLREALPGLARVGVLYDPDHIDNYMTELDAAARTHGMRLVPRAVRSRDEIDRAIVAGPESVEAIFVIPGRVTLFHQRRVAEAAIRHRLPAMSAYTAFAAAGGLMSYGANVADLLRRAAGQIHRIVEGTRPGDIPFEQPTRFELVINDATARALKLTLPQALMLRADRII